MSGVIMVKRPHSHAATEHEVAQPGGEGTAPIRARITPHERKLVGEEVNVIGEWLESVNPVSRRGRKRETHVSRVGNQPRQEPAA
jgi:hypothetical protein